MLSPNSQGWSIPQMPSRSHDPLMISASSMASFWNSKSLSSLLTSSFNFLFSISRTSVISVYRSQTSKHGMDGLDARRGKITTGYIQLWPFISYNCLYGIIHSRNEVLLVVITGITRAITVDVRWVYQPCCISKVPQPWRTARNPTVL